MESINRSNNVIITGGTQGLGFSIAKELISNGCENILILGSCLLYTSDAADE